MNSDIMVYCLLRCYFNIPAITKYSIELDISILFCDQHSIAIMRVYCALAYKNLRSLCIRMNIMLDYDFRLGVHKRTFLYQTNVITL